MRISPTSMPQATSRLWRFELPVQQPGALTRSTLHQPAMTAALLDLKEIAPDGVVRVVGLFVRPQSIQLTGLDLVELLEAGQ
jgi:hypothetical protein